MIKPALTRDLARLAIEGQSAGERQARVGVVKRGVAWTLLAVTLFALQYQRLGGIDLEVQLANFALHLEGGGKESLPL